MQVNFVVVPYENKAKSWSAPDVYFVLDGPN